MIGKIIKHIQNNNTVDTHRDVPDDLQAEIRMEDQHRNDRKRKAEVLSQSRFPPVTITNVMSGHSDTGTLCSTPPTVSALEIPGYRDDAVQDYVRYLPGKGRSEKHRAEFQKSR